MSAVPNSSKKSEGINFFDAGPDPVEEELNALYAALDKDAIQCVIRERNVYGNAHDGYVYCLLHAKCIPNVEGEVVISGSGDGSVKVNKRWLHFCLFLCWLIHTFRFGPSPTVV